MSSILNKIINLQHETREGEITLSQLQIQAHGFKNILEQNPPNINVSKLSECCSNFIKSICIYESDDDLSEFLKSTRDVVRKWGQTTENIIQTVIECALDPSIEFKKLSELILFANSILNSNSIEYKEEFYLFKLMDILCECGDYNLQLSLLEMLFRLNDDRSHTTLEGYFPKSTRFQEAFLAIDKNHFEVDARHFLSLINNAYKTVTSVKAEKAFLDKLAIKPPMEFLELQQRQRIWVDFNTKSSSISITAENDSYGLECFIIESNIVTEYVKESSRKNGNTEISLIFSLNSSIKTLHENSLEKFGAARTLYLIFKETEDINYVMEHHFPIMFNQLEARSNKTDSNDEVYSEVMKRRVECVSMYSPKSRVMSAISKQTFSKILARRELPSPSQTSEFHSCKNVMKTNRCLVVSAEQPSPSQTSEFHSCKNVMKTKRCLVVSPEQNINNSSSNEGTKSSKSYYANYFKTSEKESVTYKSNIVERFKNLNESKEIGSLIPNSDFLRTSNRNSLPESMESQEVHVTNSSQLISEQESKILPPTVTTYEQNKITILSDIMISNKNSNDTKIQNIFKTADNIHENVSKTNNEKKLNESNKFYTCIDEVLINKEQTQSSGSQSTSRNKFNSNNSAQITAILKKGRKADSQNNFEDKPINETKLIEKESKLKEGKSAPINSKILEKNGETYSDKEDIANKKNDINQGLSKRFKNHNTINVESNNNNSSQNKNKIFVKTKEIQDEVPNKNLIHVRTKENIANKKNVISQESAKMSVNNGETYSDKKDIANKKYDISQASAKMLENHNTNNIESNNNNSCQNKNKIFVKTKGIQDKVPNKNLIHVRTKENFANKKNVTSQGSAKTFENNGETYSDKKEDRDNKKNDIGPGLSKMFENYNTSNVESSNNNSNRNKNKFFVKIKEIQDEVPNKNLTIVKTDQNADVSTSEEEIWLWEMKKDKSKSPKNLKHTEQNTSDSRLTDKTKPYTTKKETENEPTNNRKLSRKQFKPKTGKTTTINSQNLENHVKTYTTKKDTVDISEELAKIFYSQSANKSESNNKNSREDKTEIYATRQEILEDLCTNEEKISQRKKSEVNKNLDNAEYNEENDELRENQDNTDNKLKDAERSLDEEYSIQNKKSLSEEKDDIRSERNDKGVNEGLKKNQTNLDTKLQKSKQSIPHEESSMENTQAAFDKIELQNTQCDIQPTIIKESEKLCSQKEIVREDETENLPEGSDNNKKNLLTDKESSIGKNNLEGTPQFKSTTPKSHQTNLKLKESLIEEFLNENNQTVNSDSDSDIEAAKHPSDMENPVSEEEVSDIEPPKDKRYLTKKYAALNKFLANNTAGDGNESVHSSRYNGSILSGASCKSMNLHKRMMKLQLQNQPKSKSETSLIKTEERVNAANKKSSKRKLFNPNDLSYLEEEEVIQPPQTYNADMENFISPPLEEQTKAYDGDTEDDNDSYSKKQHKLRKSKKSISEKNKSEIKEQNLFEKKTELQKTCEPPSPKNKEKDESVLTSKPKSVYYYNNQPIIIKEVQVNLVNLALYKDLDAMLHSDDSSEKLIPESSQNILDKNNEMSVSRSLQQNKTIEDQVKLKEAADIVQESNLEELNDSFSNEVFTKPKKTLKPLSSSTDEESENIELTKETKLAKIDTKNKQKSSENDILPEHKASGNDSKITAEKEESRLVKNSKKIKESKVNKSNFKRNSLNDEPFSSEEINNQNISGHKSRLSEKKLSEEREISQSKSSREIDHIFRNNENIGMEETEITNGISAKPVGESHYDFDQIFDKPAEPTRPKQTYTDYTYFDRSERNKYKNSSDSDNDGARIVIERAIIHRQQSPSQEKLVDNNILQPLKDNSFGEKAREDHSVVAKQNEEIKEMNSISKAHDQTEPNIKSIVKVLDNVTIKPAREKQTNEASSFFDHKENVNRLNKRKNENLSDSDEIIDETLNKKPKTTKNNNFTDKKKRSKGTKDKNVGFKKSGTNIKSYVDIYDEDSDVPVSKKRKSKKDSDEDTRKSSFRGTGRIDYRESFQKIVTILNDRARIEMSRVRRTVPQRTSCEKEIRKIRKQSKRLYELAEITLDKEKRHFIKKQAKQLYNTAHEFAKGLLKFKN